MTHNESCVHHRQTTYNRGVMAEARHQTAAAAESDGTPGLVCSSQTLACLGPTADHDTAIDCYRRTLGQNDCQSTEEFADQRQYVTMALLTNTTCTQTVFDSDNGITGKGWFDGWSLTVPSTQ